MERFFFRIYLAYERTDSLYNKLVYCISINLRANPVKINVIDKRPIWKLPSGEWIQDDEKKRFFLLNRESREEINQSGLEIIFGAKWHKANKPCDGYYPIEFDYCPFCGMPLSSVEHLNDFWVPPYGDGSGLRLVPKGIIQTASIPKQWVDQDKNRFPLPRQHGDYEFIVAAFGTKSPVLFAFDRMTGLIDYFSPAQKEWISLSQDLVRRVSESHLPNWSWSAALIREKVGLAVPTDQGPVWIALDWLKNKYTPVFGQGECIGGAAALQNQIFIPVFSEGALAIHSFEFSALKWKQIGDYIRDGVQKSGEAHFFSVPIVDEERHVIYWVGIKGLLTFDLEKRSCLLRPWEKNNLCRAVPELGPPYRDCYGYFWQICYNDQKNAFGYHKLGGDDSDWTKVNGARFSSGVSCFSRYYDLWEEPWAEGYYNQQDREPFIRVPLLCLDEESKATITVSFGSETDFEIIEIIKNKSKTYNADIRIESEEPSIELRTHDVINLHTPWELRSFIYQQYLYVYLINEAVCYKWRLT